MLRFFLNRKKHKLEKLQNISRGLAYILPFMEDKRKQEIGYTNLDKLQKKIIKLYEETRR